MAEPTGAFARLASLRGQSVELGLAQITRLLDKVDHPERDYPAVHVAGTNGKGSIARMVSALLAQSARTAGAELRTGSPVRRIVVDNGRVTGVETEDGEIHGSHMVVSNADPKRTVMRLVGARHFETTFVKRIHHLRSGGKQPKAHLA